MEVFGPIIEEIVTNVRNKGIIFKKRFYLFSERGEGREKERKRNINMWLSLTRPTLGTWHTAQLGIEPATPQFTGPCSTH